MEGSQMPYFTVTATGHGNTYSYKFNDSFSTVFLDNGALPPGPPSNFTALFVDSTLDIAALPLNISLDGNASCLVWGYSSPGVPFFLSAEPGHLSTLYPYLYGQNDTVNVNLAGGGVSTLGVSPGVWYSTIALNIADASRGVTRIWAVEGDESKALWADVLQDLITRELKRVLIFVTDDSPRVKEIIKKLYPFADHQLCFLHMQRNLRMDLQKKVYAEMNPHLYLAKESATKEDGIKHFNDACSIVERTDRSYAKRLRGRIDNYLTFLSYPQEIRKFVYTTNAVESINSGLDYIRRELGGYFRSRESLDVNYFVQIANLNDSWMRAPVSMISSRSYELRQMIAMKY